MNDELARQQHVVAILETMWGDEPGQAARWFQINPGNFSGRRLYTLVGKNAFLLVTNACREKVTSASLHGTPDPEWLLENLTLMQRRRSIDVLLVCGKVAQKTFANCGFDARAMRVIEMPHPAARVVWTKESIARFSTEIQHQPEVLA